MLKRLFYLSLRIESLVKFFGKLGAWLSLPLIFIIISYMDENFRGSELSSLQAAKLSGTQNQPAAGGKPSKIQCDLKAKTILGS